MELIYKKKFIKDLLQLPLKSQANVKTVLERLKSAATLETAGVDCVLMHGQKAGQQYYRITVGNYRIGVEYVRPNLIVIMIAVRGDVYKTFPPK
jgi:mRNA interferase RelE/StbE